MEIQMKQFGQNNIVLVPPKEAEVESSNFTIKENFDIGFCNI